MRVSKYTFLFSTEDEFYVYNTLSNALINIDEESYRTIYKCKQQKNKISKNEIDDELYHVLIRKKIITDNDKDDFLFYKSIIQGQRHNQKSMHLTIAPTMDCCFDCHYCFEKKTKTYITSDIIDSIIKYVNTQEDTTDILLTWFGGEPLMAIDKMHEFYQKFRNSWNKGFKSNIITTAYHITPQVLDILKEIEVISMQITLDGKKESHNKIKTTKNCDDVFSQIIQNIDYIVDKAPEIYIGIRVNLSKENAGEYVELYRFLTERYKGKNLAVSPSFVMDRSANRKASSLDNYFFNRKECSEFILQLIRRYGIHTPWIRYPNRFFNECAIRNSKAISFDPEGYAYKCWEVIGNKKYTIGKLDDGKIINPNYININRQLYGADTLDDKTCRSCSCLPICNGGCPIQRIENEFENGNNDVCIYFKSNIPEFMKIHLNLKKNGYYNY